MKLQQSIDTLKGIVFSCILKRVAYLWLSHLLKISIKLWKQMDEMFISQFSTCEIIEKSLICLVGILQKYDESLSSFMDCFNDETSQFKNLYPFEALHALVISLKPKPFVDSLAWRPSNTFDELWRRAWGYIPMEEIVLEQNKFKQCILSFDDNKVLKD